MKKILTSTLILTSICLNSFASENHNHRVDHHAPIGVMRDHTHKKGEIMVSYRYMQMSMQGLRDADNKITNREALADYMIVPKNMKMKMHMYGAMYGLSDELTLMVSGSYITKEMELERRNGSEFEMAVSDIGDTKINAMYKFFDGGNSSAQFNFGLSIPTGENSEMQGNGRTRMAYPMQIGSGSYDLMPGLSYTNLQDAFSFGGQINAVLPLEKNDNGYKFGNQYNSTIWVAKPLNHNVSLSSRLDYTITRPIEGQDLQLVNSKNMNPIFDENLGNGEKLFGFLGANFMFDVFGIKNQRIAFEFGLPIHQRISGPILQDKYKFTIGLQKTF